jgi:hypothetical protein
MKKRHKIYYLPGMLTLVFLPILCYNYLLPYLNKDERILEITFLEKYSKYPNLQFRFDTSILSEPKYKRINTTIELTGFLDKTKLDSFQGLVHKMIKTKDTIHGVHLIFQEHAKYSAFVQSLNILKEESSYSYAPFGNHLWTLYTPLTNETLDRIKRRKIESDSLSKVNILEKSIVESAFNNRLKSITKVWEAFIGIVILAAISFYKVKRKWFS